MNETPGLSRNPLLAVVLLCLVIASGVGGMLLAKHFHGADVPVRSSQARAALPRSAAAKPTLVGVTQPTSPVKMRDLRTDANASRGPAPGGFPAESPAKGPAPAPAPGSPGYITEDRQIGLVLRRWQTALLSNDAAQVAPSYAASVERYFLRTDVSRAYVHDYMSKEETRGTTLMTYDLRDMTIEHVNADEVDVRFVANFSVNAPKGMRTGSARTLLKLRREDGDWKIFYERDFNS